MDVLELPGDVPGLAAPDVGHRGGDALIDRVGLGGGGQQHHRLGQGQPGLGQPQLEGVVHTCLDDGHRHGVGHAHILAGRAQDASYRGDHVPRLQQTGQIVEGGVRIRPPHGLHQGGGDVKMGVSLPVIAHRRLLGHGPGVLHGDKEFSLLALGGVQQKLDGVHCLSDISAAGPGNMLLYTLLADCFRSQALLHDGDPPLDGGEGVLRRDLLELKDGGPGQHRPKDGKKRVLRGGGDEGNPPVLHKLQQRLLLFFVEVLDLVQVQQHPFRGHEGADVRHDILDVGDGGGGGVEPVEGPVGPLGDDVGHRGLACPRRAVEDQVGYIAPLDDPAEQAVLAQNMPLPHHIVQGLGPYFIRQRAVRHKNTPFQSCKADPFVIPAASLSFPLPPFRSDWRPGTSSP